MGAVATQRDVTQLDFPAVCGLLQVGQAWVKNRKTSKHCTQLYLRTRLNLLLSPLPRGVAKEGPDCCVP